MRTLVIADRQEITKVGLLFLSQEIRSIGSIREPECKRELIGELIGTPDAVVVLDYTLFDFGSADELLILKARFPKSDWLLFSEGWSDDFLRRVLTAPAEFGAVLKSDSVATISEALAAASRHERLISERIADQLTRSAPVPASQQKDPLSATERGILREIAAGKTTKEIAAARCVSFHTITTHRKNIFRKLEVNNVHEATKYALRAGIIDPAEYYI